MKICIPVKDDQGLESTVSDHFGSAPIFIIYDIESKETTAINNSNKEHAHGMCQPLRALEEHNIDVVVCQGMGARAVQRLNMAGIKAYRVSGKTINDIIKKYNANELEEITPDSACSQHNCDH